MLERKRREPARLSTCELDTADPTLPPCQIGQVGGGLRLKHRNLTAVEADPKPSWESVKFSLSALYYEKLKGEPATFDRYQGKR
jgi:hypothetical protein